MEIRNASKADIQYVCDNMRETDRIEIWASHRHRPEDVPPVCPQCFAAVNGMPFCIFGCSEQGNPWLLATDQIVENRTGFLRASRRILRTWLKLYGTLTNYVHEDNQLCLDWLIWLGFSFPGSIMLNGVKFLRFEKRGVNHV